MGIIYRLRRRRRDAGYTMTVTAAAVAVLAASTATVNGKNVGTAYATTTVGKTIIPAPASIPTKRAIVVGLNKLTSIDLDDDITEFSISDPAVVDAVVKTTRRVHLLGRQTGQATATFLGRDGKPLLTLDVSVERDLAPVEALIRRLMPTARVRLEMLNDNIVITGTAATPLDASRIADLAARFVPHREQVLNMLDVQAKEQVLLRVTVAEMNRSAVRRLGVDVAEAVQAGSFTAVKIAQNAFPVTGALVNSAALGLSDAGAGTQITAAIGRGNGQMAALVQALEREGLARTLAEPNLTATSGETARFLAGGEYPVPSGSDKEGTNIVFKPFGVSLDFTPVVLSDGRISLKIATEMSELTSDGAVTVNSISIPALKVRRASSTLELPSGGAMAMAGLLSRQTRRSAEGLPGLKQLPVLGELFRSDDFLRSETELVVIVTPVLVRPAARGAIAEPGSEAEMQNAPVRAPPVEAGDGTGFGYILE